MQQRHPVEHRHVNIHFVVAGCGNGCGILRWCLRSSIYLSSHINSTIFSPVHTCSYHFIPTFSSRSSLQGFGKVIHKPCASIQYVYKCLCWFLWRFWNRTKLNRDDRHQNPPYPPRYIQTDFCPGHCKERKGARKRQQETCSWGSFRLLWRWHPKEMHVSDWIRCIL